MFEILNSFVRDAENLLIGVIVVVAIAFVAMTWMRTRALAPTLGALLLGAIVIFAVFNFRGLARIVESDVDDRGDVELNRVGQ